MTTKQILIGAKAVTGVAAALHTDEKNRALEAMADAIESAADAILQANCQDVNAAKGSVSEVMLDRLLLTDSRIRAMAEGIRQVVQLPDPVGHVRSENIRPNGLCIQKVGVPMGVIAIIYESRPNVTSDAAALALKSGNVCVLRGGKEAFRSANAIVTAMQEGLRQVGLPAELIQLVQDTSRTSANELMEAVGYVDLLIPRGGAGLIRACTTHAKVPCIQTGTGICHVYVDAKADLRMALQIVNNAKTSRPSVCNAAEVCLVHRDVAESFLPMLYQCLVTERPDRPVELRLDQKAAEIIPGTAAEEEDFDTEFLDYVLAVRIVDNVYQAVEHIAKHSSGHSEAIISEDADAVSCFTRMVDSAAVYVNCSTRFTDGGEFGLGCEMGISTQKMHARGPMGLEELCSYKYLIRGNGQIR